MFQKYKITTLHFAWFEIYSNHLNFVHITLSEIKTNNNIWVSNKPKSKTSKICETYKKLVSSSPIKSIFKSRFNYPPLTVER
jgi:hypothetical protein